MLPDLSPTEWLSVASFSLGLGALVLRFFVKDPSAKAHLSTAVLLLAVISVGINAIQSGRRANDVQRLGERIVLVLGNQEKTADQVVIELNYPDMKVFTSALVLLENEARIESRVVDATLTKEQKVPVRVWRALASNPHE